MHFNTYYSFKVSRQAYFHKVEVSGHCSVSLEKSHGKKMQWTQVILVGTGVWTSGPQGICYYASIDHLA